MQIYKFSSIIFILLFTTPTFAIDIDKRIEMAFKNLSFEYGKKHPMQGVKNGIVVIPFAENSNKAKANQLGSTLAEMISNSVVKFSQFFYLVERDNLEKILEEIALNQTGIIDNSSIISSSKLQGALAIITGSISEIKNQFSVSIKIIDVETGKVDAIEKIEIPQNDLIRKNEILALETISQYGLGINFQWSTAFISSDQANFTHLTDIYLNYRPLLWLNLKMGGTVLSVNFLSDIADASNVYPTLSSQQNPLITSLLYDGGNLNLISPYVGLEYNYMFSQKFSTSIGTGFIFGSDELTQQYSDGVFFDDDDGQVYPMKTFRIEQEIDTQYFVRFESKTQYFISPRMTIGLYLSYLLGANIDVDRAVVNDDYREFPNEGDPAPQEFKEKYFNMSTTILGDGFNVEHVNLSGFTTGLSFNFYF